MTFSVTKGVIVYKKEVRSQSENRTQLFCAYKITKKIGKIENFAILHAVFFGLWRLK